MSGLRKNIIYQFLYELLIIFIPLFTIPYVSRILGAENIGIFLIHTLLQTILYCLQILGLKIMEVERLLWSGIIKKK